MYLISGNITSNVTGNLLVITGNGNIGNITSNFRTLLITDPPHIFTFVEIPPQIRPAPHILPTPVGVLHTALKRPKMLSG